MPADEYLQAVLLGRDTLDAVDNAAVRALPAGDHFAAHLHSTMELIICTEGSITLTLFRTPVTLAPGSSLQNRHLMTAAQYIQQHYAEKITAAQVAEYCGVTPRRLSALFSQHLNMNFSTYLIYFRINKAVELMDLHGRRYPLTRLALDTGFGSLAHFSATFKEKMGVAPTRYFGLQKGGSDIIK